ncbi:MAG: type II toxin-antitoxin system PemK/MazF family toxin [Candidatus Latescibacteria bacterium]|nr:type II toxin-antitoxin system PemK/MazF family toxin [Candidatus Latescibacterota bacterium]
MGAFVKGDVVVTPFPFSDLSAAKKRPALVVAALTGDDVFLCQITSQATSDTYAIPLLDSGFASGGLRQTSNIRPNRLFTADSNIILYRAGVVTEAKLQEVVTKIVQIVTA